MSSVLGLNQGLGPPLTHCPMLRVHLDSVFGVCIKNHFPQVYLWGESLLCLCLVVFTVKTHTKYNSKCRAVVSHPIPRTSHCGFVTLKHVGTCNNGGVMRNQNIRDTDDTNSGGGWMDGSNSHISIVGCIPGPGVTAVITQQQGHNSRSATAGVLQQALLYVVILCYWKTNAPYIVMN